MRAVIQRVLEGAVKVEGETIGEIGAGLVVLTAFGVGDEAAPPLEKFLEKILTMRIFPDERGRFDRSVKDIEGGLLLVPQFTLFADCSKGRRPEFFGALSPERAAQHFEKLLEVARTRFHHVQSGKFGADMKVELINDGPVTIILDVE